MTYAREYRGPFSNMKDRSIKGTADWTRYEIVLDGRINLSKSDALPERDLLLKRRDCIVGYWEILRNRQQRRFDYEIQVFTGHRELGSTWQNSVFRRFAEAVEVTAVQRGCERWRP